MTARSSVADAVGSLCAAHAAGVSLPRSGLFQNLDIAEAYEVRAEVLRQRALTAGAAVAGHKVSAANSAARDRLGLTEPLYGTYLRSEVLDSPATVPASRLWHPVAEVEAVFRFRSDAHPHMTAAEFVAATDVCVGIELADSRFEDWAPGRLTLPEVVADNVLANRLVVGDAIHAAGIQDWRFTASLHCDGERLAVTEPDEAFDPLAAAMWCVERVLRDGGTVTEGTVIASGMILPPVWVSGSMYQAEIEGIGTAKVQIQ